MQFIPDTIDFKLYLKETDAKINVKHAADYIDMLKEDLRLTDREPVDHLPWQKADDSFSFRKGEVTLWSGQNGHGKSLMIGEVALSLIGQGKKICIASFEMNPKRTLQRMARQWMGINPISQEFQSESGISALEDLYDQFKDWTKDKLFLYTQQGTVETENIIGLCRYAAKELGVTHVVVDNLAKCVRHEDDYNGQKMFIDEITSIARDYSIHIHVVHHLKKPANENAVPDKHDNKGSGAITDQVDNVMLIWRNKIKEDDVKENGPYAKLKDDADHYLLCRKQRNYDGSGEGEPTIKLWFHRDSQQYVERLGQSPMAFYAWPHTSL